MTYTEESMAAAIVRRLFDATRYSCVVNVSYGFLNHEADLIIMNGTRRLYEVEIKTTLADLKADFKKKHHHDDPKIERLFYAVPAPLLEKAQQIIPEQYGIISVNLERRPRFNFLTAERVREAKKLREYQLDPTQVIQLLRLGTMRYWTRRRYESTELDILDGVEPSKKELQLELFDKLEEQDIKETQQ